MAVILKQCLRTFLAIMAVCIVAAAFMIGCGSPPGEKEFDQAVEEFEKGNYPRAQVLFEKSINRRPASAENALAHNYLGVASVRLGKLDRAVRDFENSRRLRVDLFDPAYNLGAILWDLGQVQESRELLSEASMLDMRDTRALALLAQTYYEERRFEEARKELYKAIDRSPDRPELLTSLARVDYYLEGPLSALSDLMFALEKDPSFAPALFNLACIYDQAGEYHSPGRALAFFRRFLQVEKEGDQAEYARQRMRQLQVAAAPLRNASVSLTPSQPQTVYVEEPPLPEPERPKTAEDYIAEANALLEQGKEVEGLERYLKAAEMAGQDQDYTTQERALVRAVDQCGFQAKAHAAYARFQAGRGRYEGALLSFNKALELDPNNVELLRGQAEASVEVGHHDTALVALKRAVRLDPENADALWDLAFLYDEFLGMQKQAAAVYLDFEQKFPSDRRVLQARTRAEKLAPEIQTVERQAGPSSSSALRNTVDQGRRLNLVAGNSSNPEAAVEAYNKGYLYQQRDDWTRAIYFYRQALQHNPRYVDAYYNLGMVYNRHGDLDLSQDAFERALQYDPEKVDARYNLARIFMERGESDKAMDQLNRILRSDSRYALAHFAMAVIYAGKDSQKTQARHHYQKFLRLDPNNPLAGSAREWLNANDG